MKTILSIHMKPVTLIILFVFIIVSCNKVLDVEPKMFIKNEDAIKSTKDLRNVLNGAYDGLQSLMSGNLIMFADLLADDTEVDESYLKPWGTLEIYNRATSVQIGLLRDTWKTAYSTIGRANQVIYIIDNDSIKDEESDAAKDLFKGEALFIRAMAHYEILRFWAQPYDVDNQGGNSQPGVPYKTIPVFSKDAEMSMARNSVEEVYNYVITDLKEAEQLLSQAGLFACESTEELGSAYVNHSRASAMACDAYLARVYFFKGDYINASVYASKVINSGYYSLNTDLHAAFRSTENEVSDEVIFQLVNIADDQSNNIAYNYNPSTSKPLFTGVYADFNSIYKSYDNRRKNSNYVQFWALEPKKLYVRKYAVASPVSNNVCIIRLAEIHLIRAESEYLSNGNMTDAFDSYKAVRVRAVDETHYNAELPILWTNDDFLKRVRDERRIEMAFEGDRYHNLRRLKLPVRDGVAYNDPSLLFKIPQEEISGNSLMEQNP